MKYHLAQLNIAEFIEDAEYPNNKEFIDNLDRVNALAESSDGFVWRLIRDGSSAIDIHPFDNPRIIVNMSVWVSKEHLQTFVYRNTRHLSFMKRRREWFNKIQSHLVLWWISEGDIPTIEDAKERLKHLKQHGPSPYAFTFSTSFPPP
ncbi:MAG: DUF3291 domain-containing protein [Pseudomonadota bacterium]